MKEKPDGYVAWHPERDRVVAEKYYKRIGKIGSTEIEAWEDLVSSNASSKDPSTVIETTLALKNTGWRIRPVKLIFLDEDTK